MMWTEDQINQVKKWAEAGFSATQIAKKLDCGISRNAVIGVVFRARRRERKIQLRGAKGFTALDLEVPSEVTISASKQRREKEAPIRKRPHRKKAKNGTPENPWLADIPLPPPRTDIPLPPSLRMTIVELRLDTCRWPEEDPILGEFTYCGNLSEKAPYCPAHRVLAYSAPESPARKRAKTVNSTVAFGVRKVLA